MNPVAALLFTITGVNLFLSSLVFFRNFKSEVHRALAGYIFLVSAWTLSMGMFYQVATIEEAHFWIRLTYIAGIVIAHMLVFFAVVFPENIPLSFPVKILIFTPAVPWILAHILFPTFLHQQVIDHGWWKDVNLVPTSYALFTIYFILVYFGAIFVVWRKYRLYQGTTRVQMLYVLFAVLIAGSFGVVFDLIFPWLKLYQFIWLGPIGTLIMISIFIYATARHRLMDLRLIVARTVAYSVIVAFVGAVFAAFFFTIFSLLLPEYERYQLFFYLLLTLILMYSFQYLKKTIGRATDRIFYKDSYDSNELLFSLTKIMASTLHLQDLTRKTLNELLNSMRVTQGAFVLFSNGNLQTVAEGYVKQPEFRLADMQFLYTQAKIIIFDEETNRPVLELMRQLDLSVSAPLSVGKEQVGVLVLGPKKSGDIYSSQDINLLNILVSEVAVAIQNSQAYDEISRFNITLREEVENATRELRFANEKLKELDTLKDEFVSVAGHELRTPMTAIKSYLWMVLQKYAKTLPEKQKLYLDRAYLSTERLIKLVNDLLNVSRIESGRVQLEKEPVNIERLAADVISEFQHQAFQDKLKVFVQRPPKLLPEVFVDPNRIKEVLVNLVGNAFKFTPEAGTIKISFEEKEGFVTVLVTDTGKGIGKDDLSKLFRKFEMLDSSSPRGEKQKGTGLGLYISRQIISLHGGQIWAESTPGQGTTFTFTLPVYKKSAATPPPSSSQIPQPEEQIGQAQVLQ